MSGICMFCGHRDIYIGKNETNKIKEIMKKLIEEKKVNTFYSGGMGNFDSICGQCVREMRNKYSHIKLCLIIPYLTKEILNNGKFYYSLYDEIINPDLGEVFPKYAIVKRNQWMVERSDYLITYINKNYGGAYNTYRFALKNKTEIINIADHNSSGYCPH